MALSISVWKGPFLCFRLPSGCKRPCGRKGRFSGLNPPVELLLCNEIQYRFENW
jgi:hypothetical protein